MTSRPAGRHLVVAAFIIGTFLSSLDVTVVGTAMPSIAEEVRGLSLYGWVFGAYLLASTVTVPLYGRLADVWGSHVVPRALTAAVIALLAALAFPETGGSPNPGELR